MVEGLSGKAEEATPRPRVAVRPFRDDDAPALAKIFHASVREIGALDYTGPQTRAWSPAMPDPVDYIERARTRVVLVAVDRDDKPLGYGDLEPDGHLDHLYCRPDRVGEGMGSALLAQLERVARSLGIQRIRVEASEGARRLLERRGYEAGPRREVTINRVAIHNHPMSKWLPVPVASASGVPIEPDG